MIVSCNKLAPVIFTWTRSLLVPSTMCHRFRQGQQYRTNDPLSEPESLTDSILFRNADRCRCSGLARQKTDKHRSVIPVSGVSGDKEWRHVGHFLVIRWPSGMGCLMEKNSTTLSVAISARERSPWEGW